MLNPSPTTPTPPERAGFALLTTGLVSLIYGLIRAGENSWSDTGADAVSPARSA